MNRDQLVKVLRLLSSENDGEVLNAARKAQELLNRNNTTWDEVVVFVRDEIHELLIEVNKSLDQLSPNDQQSFITVRERYFEAGSLQEADVRRIQYLKDLIHASSGNIIDF